MRAARVAALAALCAALPAVAHACAVCGADGGPSRSAFFWSTIALSLIPLGLFAGGLWFLRRSAGAWMRDEFAEREDAIVPAAPVAPESPRERATTGRLATTTR